MLRRHSIFHFIIVGFLFLQFSVGYGKNVKTASVIGNVQTGFQVIFGNKTKNSTVSETITNVIYEKSLNDSGWDFLEIKTNGAYPDILQAYWAGYVEGSLMYESIYMHWYNSFSGVCDERAKLCQSLQEYVDKNQNWMHEMISNYSDIDPYWYQINLFYKQLKGLSDGYTYAVPVNSSRSLSFNDILWLNLQGDFEDLFDALNTDNEEDYKPLPLRGPILPGSASCSALIKLLPGSADLYTSHDTWSSFQSMLRVQKKYILPYKLSENSTDIIPGSVMTFSSYPGVIQSGDDFYITSAGLTTLETTNGNSNRSLWQFVNSENQVFEQIRTMIANRLGHCGMSWCKTFSKYNSGTYNNQWMVVDYKRFKVGTPQSKLQDGLLWILEQLPGHIVFLDKTDILRQQSYWPSYNTPYFLEIYNLSGQQQLAEKYGDWFLIHPPEKQKKRKKNVTGFQSIAATEDERDSLESALIEESEIWGRFTYDRNPRALMFKRDHPKVVDTDSMIALMRYNDYKNDPLSRCNCTPPYSGENAIACRNDVNPINGTYPFQALGHRSHAATDMKLTTSSLAPSLRFIAISSPPSNEYMPPFRWSESDYNVLSHLGHPDLWNFGPVLRKWVLN